MQSTKFSHIFQPHLDSLTLPDKLSTTPHITVTLIDILFLHYWEPHHASHLSDHIPVTPRYRFTLADTHHTPQSHHHYSPSHTMPLKSPWPYPVMPQDSDHIIRVSSRKPHYQVTFQPHHTSFPSSLSLWPHLEATSQSNMARYLLGLSLNHILDTNHILLSLWPNLKATSQPHCQKHP